MRDYSVTFEANWIDRFGVTWTTGKQKRVLQADNRAMACEMVRGSWPEGATGTCYADPVKHSLLHMVKANLEAGRPASEWNPDFPADLIDAEPMFYPI
jgi:hypothetical protein